MLKIYTTDEVKQAMIATGERWFPARECSVCAVHTGYLVKDGVLFFDSDCLCCSYETEPKPCSWDDVAILINNSLDNTELKSVFGLIEKGD